MKRFRTWLLMVLCSLASSDMALGNLVGPALTLDKLAEESDLVFKCEAITDEPVRDAHSAL